MSIGLQFPGLSSRQFSWPSSTSDWLPLQMLMGAALWSKTVERFPVANFPRVSKSDKTGRIPARLAGYENGGQ